MLNTIKAKLDGKTLEFMEMERQNRMFKIGAIKRVFVLLCAVFDAWVFYTRFDSILNQNFYLNILLAVACAVAIDVFPVVVTNNLMKVNKTKENKFFIGIFVILFLGVVVLSVALGIMGAKELAGNTSKIRNSLNTSPVQEEVSPSQMVISVLLGFMPVITSALIIGISYVDAKTHQINTLKIQEIRLKKRIGEMKADLTYLEEGMDVIDLKAQDKVYYDIATELLDDIRLYSQIVSRRVLSMKLGDSAAAVKLMQENALRKAIDAKLKDFQADSDKALEEPQTDVKLLTKLP